MILLTNSQWPTEAEVILCRIEDQRNGEARGRFYTATYRDVEEGYNLRGMRADAIWVKDLTQLTDEGVLTLKCTLMAGLPRIKKPTS